MGFYHFRQGEAMDRGEETWMLRQMLDDLGAVFRDGHWEAIGAVVNQWQKRLVVQRTGWDSSVASFTSARAFRNQSLGPAIIASSLPTIRKQVATTGGLSLRTEPVSPAIGEPCWPQS